jgi:hypothetical protein
MAMWQQAPLDEPLRRNALSGIVQIHLARAFEAIESGLNALAELKRNPELSLCLPGNDLGMTQEAEKELLKFKRGIKKLLPEDARKELGIYKQATNETRNEGPTAEKSDVHPPADSSRSFSREFGGSPYRLVVLRQPIREQV